MNQAPNSIWTRRSALSMGMASVATILFGCSSSDEGNAGGDINGERGNAGSSGVGKVIVVGAGPAGLTTAHLLRQQGIEVLVLEALDTHGGRTRLDTTFVDFPLPLGAEWVHVQPEILSEIVNDSSISVTTKIIAYGDEAQLGWYEDGLEYEALDDSDLKFVDSGWLDFFDTYVVPGIEDTLQFNTQVTKIEHGEDEVRVTDADGVVYKADRVVLTIPLKLLQTRAVEFEPPLEEDRLDVIDGAPIWSGLKAFFVFEDEFYPAELTMPKDSTETGQRLYYDAAYGQNSAFNVLGLFAVGHWAEFYQAMSETELVDSVLAELDEIFDGAASKSYVRHLIQDWNDEPFAQAAYLADEAPSSITSRLAEPASDRLLFAGDAYTRFDDWSSVHTATRSAADTVEQLLNLG